MPEKDKEKKEDIIDMTGEVFGIEGAEVSKEELEKAEQAPKKTIPKESKSIPEEIKKSEEIKPPIIPETKPTEEIKEPIKSKPRIKKESKPEEKKEPIKTQTETETKQKEKITLAKLGERREEKVSINDLLLTLLTQRKYFFFTYIDEHNVVHPIDKDYSLYHLLDKLNKSPDFPKTLTFFNIDPLFKKFVSKEYLVKIDSDKIKELGMEDQISKEDLVIFRRLLQSKNPQFISKKIKGKEQNIIDVNASKNLNENFSRVALYISRIFSQNIQNPSPRSEKDAISDFHREMKLMLKNKTKDISKIVIETIESKEIKSEAGLSVSDHLYNFDDQDFFPIDPTKKGLKEYLTDIETYLVSFYYRRCPECKEKITPEHERLLVEYNNIYKANMSFFKSSTDSYIDIIFLQEINEAIKNTQITNILSKENRGKWIRNGTDLYQYFAQNQKGWRNQFKCKSCGKSLFKDALFHTIDYVWEIIIALEFGSPSILYGNAGDGKSEITKQFLDYIYWRYNTPYAIMNVDPNTTAYKIKGGFSPMSIGSSMALQAGQEIEIIKYGTLSRALMHPKYKGIKNKLGTGSNYFMDEMNRVELKELSFLMGFFESPYNYIFDEADLVFTHPNYRNDNRIKWIFIGTMNISDIGTESIPAPMKSRFAIIKVSYTMDQIVEIMRITMSGLSKGEQEVLKRLIEITSNWANGGDVNFPAGIRHYKRFFRLMRSGLKSIIDGSLGTVFSKDDYSDIEDDPSQYFTDKAKYYKVKRLIEYLLNSLIVMPLVDENSKQLLEKITNDAKTLITEIATNILGDIRQNQYSFYY